MRLAARQPGWPCALALLLALLLAGTTRPLAADELTKVRWPGNQARSGLYDVAGRHTQGTANPPGRTSKPAWQPGSRDRVQCSAMLDAVPVLGSVKMGLEALTGRDWVGGTCLSGGERLLRGAFALAPGIGSKLSRGVSGLWSRFGRAGRGASTVAARGVLPAAEAAPVSAIASSAQKGRAGELLSGLPKNYKHIRGAMLATAYRVPDYLNAKTSTICEVKNVRRLAYTRQLRDYVAWARENHYRVVLITRRNTRMSGPLQAAIDAGDIVLGRLLP